MVARSLFLPSQQVIPIVVVCLDSIRRNKTVNPAPKANKARIAASALAKQHFGVQHFRAPRLKEKRTMTSI
jgi:hypothetical protein